MRGVRYTSGVVRTGKLLEARGLTLHDLPQDPRKIRVME